MPLFRFKTADIKGLVQETVIEGESQADALRRLKTRKLTPVSFLGEGEAGTKQKSVFKGTKFNAVEFTDRLVPLLESGITLERSLSIIEDTMENPQAATFIRDMRQGLHEGRKFSQLIKDREAMFPRLYGNVVEVGEESGALPAVLGQMRNYLNERKQIRSYIISASIYPAAICLVCFGIVLFLLGVIVPRFAKIIAQGKTEPNFMTATLLMVSAFVQNYWYLIILFVVLAIAIPVYLIRNEEYREHWDRFVLKLPIVKNIVVVSNVATLVKTLAVMLKSGVHLLSAVQIASKVIPNSVIRASVSNVAGQLRQGEKLSHALAQSPYLPKLVTRMLAVGEEIGDVESMMERVGTRYEEELRSKIKNLLSLFEPVIIVTLGSVIAYIVVTMFMAIQDVMSF